MSSLHVLFAICSLLFELADSVPLEWERGFPCMLQHSLMPMSRDSMEARSDEPPLYLTIADFAGAKVRSYRPNQALRVRLVSDVPFTAFVMQARIATEQGHLIGHLRAGEFLEDLSWISQGVKFQSCLPAFNNSVTNADLAEKYVFEVQWLARFDRGPVQFVVTIIQADNSFWGRWKPNGGLLLPYASEKDPKAREIEKLTDDTFSGRTQPNEQEQTQESSVEEQRTNQEQIVLVNAVTVIATSTTATTTTATTTTTTAAATTSISTATTSVPRTAPTWPKPTHTHPELLSKVAPTTTTKELEDEFVAEHESQQSSRLPKKVAKTTPVDENLYDPVTGRQLKFKVQVSVDFCSSSPCQNSGTCVTLSDEDSYFCECPAAYTGQNCEDVNHCLEHKCEHGGVCKSELNTYSCQCVGEWAGERCERQCPAYLCMHGKCAVDPLTKEYSCVCEAGWTGQKCDEEMNECLATPCLNGASCADKFNGYECHCAAGYMGNNCHRPCQNIYKSCARWDKEGRCKTMRRLTNFFDKNCAFSCGQCAERRETIRTDKPLPPLLEPFAFLIGRWVANSSDFHHFPASFIASTAGYSEIWEFSVANVPMFGTPSVNFTSRAVSWNDKNDQQTTVGFLTLNQRHKRGRPFETALMSTGNDGITLVEEGKLEANKLSFKIKYGVAHPWVAENVPSTLRTERTIVGQGSTLQVHLTKESTDGNVARVTKFFTKRNSLENSFSFF